MRLIDADALLEADPEVCDDYGLEYGIECGYSREQIFNANTVDAVPVVRCKDCRFWITGTGNYFCDLDGQDRKGCWFCADGKRKGGDE